jgi:hypothetical protein
VRWPDGTLAAGATVVLYGAGPEPLVTDDGRFRFTLPYGATFHLNASISTGPDGGGMSARTIQSVTIDREDGDRTVVLRLSRQ